MLEHQAWSHAIEGRVQKVMFHVPRSLCDLENVPEPGFFHAERQWDVTHRMTTRIQQDPVRTNLAQQEGIEATHMLASLSVLAQTPPWRELAFAEGGCVANLIVTLEVKLSFSRNLGF